MNRKRVLWPLLLAAAFALGALAAQVQAGAIFLPLVANASPGQETPTPTPPPRVTVENVFCDAERYSFYGELVNQTGCAIYAEKVAIYLLDADGLWVGSEIGYSMIPRLLPGQRTPFRVYWGGPLPAWDSYNIYVHWYPIERLTVESASINEIKPRMWSMLAILRNQLPVPVKSVAVGSVLYNSSAQVMDYCAIHEHPNYLDPGAIMVVTHTFLSWDRPADWKPVACAAFAVPSENIGPWVPNQEP